MNRYLVLLMRNPGFDPALIEPHRRFLDDLRGQQRIELAGPFGDGTGGAYLLRAHSFAEATAIAQRDPLHVAAASQVSVREWKAA